LAKGKLFVKIGEACKDLDIQPYVLRYWETEFPPLSPDKSRSGQRVYSEEDLAIIRRIKELLYDEGFTIAGAKKKLETELASGGPKIRPHGKADPAPPPAPQKAAAPKSAPGPAPEPASNPGPRPAPEPAAKPARKATPKPKANPKPKATSKPKAGPKSAAALRPAAADAPLRRALEDALEEARAILTLLDG
jgi:DNA-binding transcriptional MerR regulator